MHFQAKHSKKQSMGPHEQAHSTLQRLRRYYDERRSFAIRILDQKVVLNFDLESLDPHMILAKKPAMDQEDGGSPTEKQQSLIGISSFLDHGTEDNFYDHFKFWQSNDLVSLDLSECHAMTFESLDLELIATESNQTYLEKVRSCLNDIEKGRYYQINLLRYFDIQLKSHDNQDLLQWRLIKKLLLDAPKRGFILSTQDTFIASFSPETFVSWRPESAGSYKITTHPIKGTRRASPEPWEPSTKDLAELNIIIDLMRNDLNEICETGSVRVDSPGEVHNYGTVDHRVARISGRLKNHLSLNDMFRRILPSGSITGAPKKEVLKAIASLEGRSRGYFMGNAWFFNSTLSHLDSTVLIRTINWNKEKNALQYAAGSGLTIASDPRSELEEIHHKCLVIAGANTSALAN